MSKLLIRANATVPAALTAFLLLVGLVAWDPVATRSARGWVRHTWQVLAAVEDPAPSPVTPRPGSAAVC